MTEDVFIEPLRNEDQDQVMQWIEQLNMAYDEAMQNHRDEIEKLFIKPQKFYMLRPWFEAVLETLNYNYSVYEEKDSHFRVRIHF